MMASPEHPILIRPLESHEVASLHDLWREAALEFRPQGRDALGELLSQRQSARGGFIGAFSGARLVGAVIASDDGRRGWINRLAVAPPYRRSGLASRLVETAENVLRRRGLRIIAALIDADNLPSQAMFHSAGYRYSADIQYFSKRESADV